MTATGSLQMARALQEQLREHLEHESVSGVEVLRGWAREGLATTPPVVFTSTLGTSGSVEEGWNHEWLGEPVFALSQTPGVWLDNIVLAEEGRLTWCWDAVEGLFPAGMVEEMFAAFGHRVRGLAEDDAVWDDARAELLPPEALGRIARAKGTSEGAVHAGTLGSRVAERVRAQRSPTS